MDNQGFYFNKSPEGKEVARTAKSGRVFKSYRIKESERERMKEKEAIRHILNSIYDPNQPKIPHDALNTAIVALNEVQQYQKLGSLEELQERLTPKEVVPFDSSLDPEDMQIIECPKCSRVYWMEDWGFFNFCPNCGQALMIKEKSNETT